MPINFYVCILQRIAVLIMNNVLFVNESSEFGDVAKIVSKSIIERTDWLRAKSRAKAVRLIPIYTVLKIVSAKARL